MCKSKLNRQHILEEHHFQACIWKFPHYLHDQSVVLDVPSVVRPERHARGLFSSKEINLCLLNMFCRQPVCYVPPRENPPHPQKTWIAPACHSATVVLDALPVFQPAKSGQ